MSDYISLEKGYKTLPKRNGFCQVKIAIFLSPHNKNSRSLDTPAFFPKAADKGRELCPRVKLLGRNSYLKSAVLYQELSGCPGLICYFSFIPLLG